jgi:hypothetical protein
MNVPPPPPALCRTLNVDELAHAFLMVKKSNATHLTVKAGIGWQIGLHLIEGAWYLVHTNAIGAVTAVESLDVPSRL